MTEPLIKPNPMLTLLYDNNERLKQTETKETPGAAGFSAFYDTGVYDPTYIGLSTAGVTTYAGQDGSWTRTGNMITVWGRVVWTNATGTGVAIISLPVTAIFTRVSRFVVNLYPVNLTFANGGVVGVIDTGTSALGFVMNSPATNASGTLVTVETAGDVTFSCSYEVA